MSAGSGRGSNSRWPRQPARRVVFCAHREWAQALRDRLRREERVTILAIDAPEELTPTRLRSFRPDLALFPDWSWKVPRSILASMPCVGFHAAPLPQFRGGSPIQNQIAAGVKRTKITAFFMTEELDAGDILMQTPLSLGGSLQQIFARLRRSTYPMILRILQGQFRPRPQVGTPSVYARRTPAMSALPDLERPLETIYDHIRMLADPYPNAFLDIGTRRIIFKNARFDGHRIDFQGEIVSRADPDTDVPYARPSPPDNGIEQ